MGKSIKLDNDTFWDSSAVVVDNTETTLKTYLSNAKIKNITYSSGTVDFAGQEIKNVALTPLESIPDGYRFFALGPVRTTGNILLGYLTSATASKADSWIYNPSNGVRSCQVFGSALWVKDSIKD